MNRSYVKAASNRRGRLREHSSCRSDRCLERALRHRRCSRRKAVGLTLRRRTGAGPTVLRSTGTGGVLSSAAGRCGVSSPHTSAQTGGTSLHVRSTRQAVSGGFAAERRTPVQRLGLAGVGRLRGHARPRGGHRYRGVPSDRGRGLRRTMSGAGRAAGLRDFVAGRKIGVLLPPVDP